MYRFAEDLKLCCKAICNFTAVCNAEEAVFCDAWNNWRAYPTHPMVLHGIDVLGFRE